MSADVLSLEIMAILLWFTWIWSRDQELDHPQGTCRQEARGAACNAATSGIKLLRISAWKLSFTKIRDTVLATSAYYLSEAFQLFSLYLSTVKKRNGVSTSNNLL